VADTRVICMTTVLNENQPVSLQQDFYTADALFDAQLLIMLHKYNFIGENIPHIYHLREDIL